MGDTEEGADSGMPSLVAGCSSEEEEHQAPAVDIEGDDMLLTPAMAQLWQQLSFQQFVLSSSCCRGLHGQRACRRRLQGLA